MLQDFIIINCQQYFSVLQTLNTLKSLTELFESTTPSHYLSKMSYNTSFTSFTSASYYSTPSSPSNPFALFISAQSPRDTHATYEDLRSVLRPSNAARHSASASQKKTSAQKFGLKKFFGGN